jgi:hypothetical protein
MKGYQYFVLLITHEDGSESWLQGNQMAVESRIVEIQRAEPAAKLKVIVGREADFKVSTYQHTVCRVEV